MRFTGFRSVEGQRQAVFRLQSDVEVAYASSASAQLIYHIQRGGGWAVMQPEEGPFRPDKVLRADETADYIVPLKTKDGTAIKEPFSVAVTTWRPPSSLRVQLHLLTSPGETDWEQNTI